MPKAPVSSAVEAFDYQNAPGFLIRRLQQQAVAAFAVHCAAADLSPLQFAALNALLIEASLDQASLAERICLDAATTGAVLLRLEQKALLERRADPQDKRRKRLVLTPEGLSVLATMQPGVDAAQQEMLKDLSATERARLLALIKKTLLSQEKPA